MKKIDIKFKKLEIIRAFSRDNSVEIRLIVNDGKDKALQKSIRLENVAEAADELIQEVRDKIKAAHKATPMSDDILSGIVVFRLQDDDELLMDKITRFLAAARDKMRTANLGKHSYYDVESQLKRNIIEF